MEHSAVTYTDHMCSRAAVLHQPIGTWMREWSCDTCEVRNIKRGYCIQSAHLCIEHIAVTDMSEMYGFFSSTQAIMWAAVPEYSRWVSMIFVPAAFTLISRPHWRPSRSCSNCIRRWLGLLCRSPRRRYAACRDGFPRLSYHNNG